MKSQLEGRFDPNPVSFGPWRIARAPVRSKQIDRTDPWKGRFS